ncbi:hypothetical protein AC578_6581 [Pseudocercospora eumusae]|uniref:Uncharacterized protein n=1 Tax=Pseudocercospora eumusae TaxID=321146 RepID=A0A139HHR5_9PEZI|nr:hypothetical protein AC578_6581 [Pseudocercospora eumusae]
MRLGIAFSRTQFCAADPNSGPMKQPPQHPSRTQPATAKDTSPPITIPKSLPAQDREFLPSVRLSTFSGDDANPYQLHLISLTVA